MTQSEVSIKPVHIQADEAVLEGDLAIPDHPLGMILFAHGSGSSRHSLRNRLVAEALQEQGFGTLLFDLLTSQEEVAEQYTRHLRFDIGMLARRLMAATAWIQREEATRGLEVGYFGASTGAAAAIVAAAHVAIPIRAIVSRGGRPDLAENALEKVSAPVLLIVGGDDYGVIELNQEAFQRLAGPKEMTLVPGASHLFEEEGKLETVASLASDWFMRYLATAGAGTRPA